MPWYPLEWAPPILLLESGLLSDPHQTPPGRKREGRKRRREGIDKKDESGHDKTQTQNSGRDYFLNIWLKNPVMCVCGRQRHRRGCGSLGYQSELKEKNSLREWSAKPGVRSSLLWTSVLWRLLEGINLYTNIRLTDGGKVFLWAIRQDELSSQGQNG